MYLIGGARRGPARHRRALLPGADLAVSAGDRPRCLRRVGEAAGGACAWPEAGAGRPQYPCGAAVRAAETGGRDRGGAPGKRREQARRSGQGDPQRRRIFVSFAYGRGFEAKIDSSPARRGKEFLMRLLLHATRCAAALLILFTTFAAARDKSAWSYEGGLCVTTNGSISTGPGFLLAGRVTSGDFFHHLEPHDRESGT